jgi:hypothetical protein
MSETSVEAVLVMVMIAMNAVMARAIGAVDLMTTMM